MKLPEAKTWANWSPSTGYATYIPHHHFKVWLQYYCKVPLFQPGTRCQRPQCAAYMDTYGDHLLYCERGTYRIWRHDAQVKLLARDLAKVSSPFLQGYRKTIVSCFLRQRALFVTSRAACRRNRILLARENVDSPLAAIAVATEHNAQCAS